MRVTLFESSLNAQMSLEERFPYAGDIEKILIEDAFRKAINRLKYLLPFHKPEGKRWGRLEDLSGGMNTNVLQNVVLDTISEMNRKSVGKSKQSTGDLGEKLAEKAINSMYDHVYAREVIERNQYFGDKILELLTSGLIEYDLPEEERLKTMENFLVENDDYLELQKTAKAYKSRQESDSEAHLAEVLHAVEEVKNELRATIEAWRIHEKEMDNEVYETNARIDVELQHTADFTEHQLQYLAFTRDFEEDNAYKRRLQMAREVEFSKLIHRSAMDLLNEAFEQQDDRHNRIRNAEENEQARLENILMQHHAKVDDMEGELTTLRLATQHHNEIISHLRKVRAEEVAQEEKLLRYMNAVVRIQRWWRFKLWMNRKKKKKKKGKKGKRKGKSKGKAKKK